MENQQRERDMMRLLVVDEHEVTAIGLEMALTFRGWDVQSSWGPTGDDVVRHAERLQPMCVLLDHRLGERIGDGFDLIASLASTGTAVVVFTAERRRAVLAQCLEAGADGWIPKSASMDELHAALVRVRDGGSVIGPTDRAAHLDALRAERTREQQVRATFEQLSTREACVLAALADGLNAEEIARENFVSVATVRSQIRGVLIKLGVRSQLTAASIGGAHRELLPNRDRSVRDRRRIVVRRPREAQRTAVSA